MKRAAEVTDEPVASFFIPKKKSRRVPARRCNDNGEEEEEGSQWLDEAKRGDVERQTALDEAALDRKRDDVLATAYMAMNLYLLPKVVFSITLYWLATYVNYCFTDEVRWFTDHIERLLAEPVAFGISSSRGISSQQSAQVKHNLLLRFAGSALHAVPNEYFIVQANQTLLAALIHLTGRATDCFLVVQHYGLRGELELAGFAYDRVLNFFYEPSFFVISAYFVYLNQLFYQSGGRDMVTDFAPVLGQILQPLQRLPASPGCLSPANSNYAEKKQTFFADLAQLRDILYENLDRDDIVARVRALWEAKASQCFSYRAERYLQLREQLTSD